MRSRPSVPSPQGKPWDPFGVPFTIKDTFDTAGILTTRGSKLYQDCVPTENAEAVNRFIHAGAIPLAKTNVPEFAAWFETDNLVIGRTNNPWDLERTPGGSSGGESAAIAAGMSPIGIGSDVGISVRGPAAFTGIVALKATHGNIPLTGHFPPIATRFWHVGPMARSVRDVALGYRLLSECIEDPINATNVVRVGWTSAAFGPVDREVAGAVAEAAALLVDAGFDVAETELVFMAKRDWLSVFTTLWSAEMIPFVQRISRGRESELHAIGAGLAAATPPSQSDVSDAEVALSELKAFFSAYFLDYDVLLCPVNPIAAPRHAKRQLDVDGALLPAANVMRMTSPFNLTGHPALSIPTGMTSSGLPLSVQLIARPNDEATILRLGALLEKSSGLKT